MNSNRERAVLAALALAGLLGLVMAASAQVSGTALQQYEQKIKTLDRSKPNDIYDCAKWCYQNGLADEAQALALEANQKAPDDLRPKYLLYILAGGAGGGGETVRSTEEDKLLEASITEAEVAEIYKNEGDLAMSAFRQVQQMMLNSCGALKCHGGGNPDSKWILIRRNVTEKKTLAENFRSVNRYVNRENAADSPLLLKPLKGREVQHPEVVFRSGTNDAVHKTILKWIGALKKQTDIIWGKARTAPVPATPSK